MGTDKQNVEGSLFCPYKQDNIYDNVQEKHKNYLQGMFTRQVHVSVLYWYQNIWVTRIMSYELICRHATYLFWHAIYLCRHKKELCLQEDYVNIRWGLHAIYWCCHMRDIPWIMFCWHEYLSYIIVIIYSVST